VDSLVGGAVAEVLGDDAALGVLLDPAGWDQAAATATAAATAASDVLDTAGVQVGIRVEFRST
jgi:hypothetical protein